MYICTAEQMKNADGYAINNLGIPGTELMYNAADAIFEEIRARVGESEGKRIAVLASSGNNGGDGLALAGIAREHGLDADVLLVSDREMSDDAKYYFDKLGGRNIYRFSEERAECEARIKEADVIVDAMYGTGFRGELTGVPAQAAALAAASAALKVAADIPSGCCCDSGDVAGEAFMADLTVTFSAKKPCHFLFPAAGCCGEVALHDIGIPEEAIESVSPNIFEITPQLVKSFLPPRSLDSHKGSFGRLLTFCGSEQMTGAAVLCAGASLSAGAGLTEVAGTEAVIRAVSARYAEPVYTLLPGEIKSAGTALLSRMEKADAIACGCGLGVTADNEYLLGSLMHNAKCPAVVDADGITLISRNIDILKRRGCDCVLTPHPLEMARLTGISAAQVQEDRIGVASAYACENGVTVVLKGANSLVAAPDGRVYINAAACSGLAKGGSGDVLTGLIGALLAQGLGCVQAACAGVFIHARAGLAGAAALTDYCLRPSLLNGFFPGVFKEILECD